jgi:hypothetical protein
MSTFQPPFVNDKEGVARSKLHDDPEFCAQVVARYYTLCDERDAVYERAKPVEERLAEASARVIAAQTEEAALAREVEAIWGSGHLARKKEIGQIAQAFIRVPKRA